MQPIMLRSFGRSGSTLMMQVLGSSPNVVFDRDYPFEKRHLTYLHRLAFLPSKPVDNDEQWGPDGVFNKNTTRLGPIPYSNVSIFDSESLSQDLLKRVWNGFSAQLVKKASDSIDSNKPTYYAEKVVHDICDDFNHVTNAKNLFLFRDPRDEFLSIKSFNEKRGFNGFGWEENDTNLTFAKKLCAMRKNFMHHLSNIENDERRLKVSYEKFMLNPYAGTEEISKWLNLELDYNSVLKNINSVKKHITSKSPEQSVARWKNELSPSIKEVFRVELGEELTCLGYEI